MIFESKFLSFAYVFLSAVSFFGAANQARADLNPNCSKLVPFLENSSDASSIEKSGCYYLDRNFSLGWIGSFPEGGLLTKKAQKGPIINIDADSVLFNLNGKTVSSKSYVGGIEISPTSNPFKGQITIRNGTLILKNGDSSDPYSGVGIRLGYDQSPNKIKYPHYDFDNSVDLANLPAGDLKFRQVRYVLEDLTIKAGYTAAILSGDGIVVRNCIIEVEGPNALAVFGPNAIIENNTIVYKYVVGRQRVGALKDSTLIRSAIYLHGADNAIIRGNTIKIQAGDLLANAVSAISSKNVRIDGNKFSNNRIVELLGDSSAILVGNLTKNGLLGGEQIMPDQVLESVKKR